LGADVERREEAERILEAIPSKPKSEWLEEYERAIAIYREIKDQDAERDALDQMYLAVPLWMRD
jgi:hypothetical protein